LERGEGVEDTDWEGVFGDETVIYVYYCYVGERYDVFADVCFCVEVA
jgi:hypothetical protein